MREDEPCYHQNLTVPRGRLGLTSNLSPGHWSVFGVSVDELKMRSVSFILAIKPLSVNQAWQGRRFSTTAKKNYERTVELLLPHVQVVGAPYYRVFYDFHLTQFARSDWDNLCKVLQDSIVAHGIITDDRMIVEAHVRKFPAKQDRIVIRIESCELEE